jgi:hypothetical protein
MKTRRGEVLRLHFQTKCSGDPGFRNGIPFGIFYWAFCTNEPTKFFVTLNKPRLIKLCAKCYEQNKNNFPETVCKEISQEEAEVFSVMDS